jgi:hypothetical protein
MRYFRRKLIDDLERKRTRILKILYLLKNVNSFKLFVKLI